MIKSRFNQMRARDGQIESLSAIATRTGVARSALTNLAAQDFTGTTTNTIDALCKYFGCGVGDLLEYVPETEEAK